MYNTNNNNEDTTQKYNSDSRIVQDKEAMGGIKALRQSFEALEERPENTTNFLSRVTRGLYREKGNMIIDSKTSVLNKYFGSDVISSNYNNEENRRALQVVFHDHIMDTVTGLQQIAHRNNDVMSSYKVYELTNRLLSMPIKEYDTKTVYNMLLQLETIGDNVALGIPLASALSSNHTLSNIDNLHRGYMDKYKASQLDIYDESISSFLKAGISGFSLSGASVLDSIINTFRFVGGYEDMESGIIGGVKRIIPNLTKAEELSISGQIGSVVGSYGSAFALFGVPTTAEGMLQYALIPKGISLMQNIFGISDYALDKAMGLVGGYVIGKRLYNAPQSISSAYEQLSENLEGASGESIGTNSIKNEQSYYTSVYDTIERFEDPISREDSVKNFMESNNNYIETLTEKEAQKFTKTTERIFDNYDANANDPVDVQISDDSINSHILEVSSQGGHSVPITYMEVSDRSIYISQAEAKLLSSGIPEYIETAKQTRDSKNTVMTNSVLRTFVGDDYNTIPNTIQSAGDSFTSLLEASDASFQNTSNKLYKKLDLAIKDLSTKIDNESPIFNSIASEFISLYNDLFEVDIDSALSEQFSKSRKSKQLYDAYPNLTSHIGQLKQSILERDIVSITQSISDMITSMGNKERDLRAQGRGSDRKTLLEGSNTIKDFRTRIYQAISKENKQIEQMEIDARTSYAEGTGKLKHIIRKYFGKSIDPTNIGSKLSPEAIYTKLINRTSFLTELSNVLKETIINNEELLSSMNTFIKTMLVHEFDKVGIKPNTPSDALKILENSTRGSGRLASIFRLSQTLQGTASRFKEFLSRKRSNDSSKLSDAVSNSVFKTWIYSALNNLPYIRNILSTIDSLDKSKQLDIMHRFFKYRLENPSADNIDMALHFAKSFDKAGSRSGKQNIGESVSGGFDYRKFVENMSKSKPASFNNSRRTHADNKVKGEGPVKGKSNSLNTKKKDEDEDN